MFSRAGLPVRPPIVIVGGYTVPRVLVLLDYLPGIVIAPRALVAAMISHSL